ncbi:MAG: glycosyltransferase family 4 protein [Anaerolineales bacterium]|nr:glycosyltransferase family 4 protein [Anaerolineales bacterium]MCB8951660.1 glycosyltransferase family 4 protein [Ardenticatenales bacterium]
MEGGVGAFTQELARALAALGHDVTIFTNSRARPPDTPRRLNLLRQPVELAFAHLYPRAYRWRWRDVGLLADLVMEKELDVVNIQYQAAAYNMRHPAINLAPWRLKGLVPTVVTFHDLRVPYLFPKAGPLRRLAVRRMAADAHGVIATNRADADALAAWGIAATVIPIGSNITATTPAPTAIADLRHRLGLAPDDLLLGYFGFLNPSKGADTLLTALAACPPHTHLVFIGGRTGASDPTTNQAFFAELDDLITRLDLGARVHWTGFVPEAAVSTYLHAADLMVMPYRDGVSLRRGTLMAVLAHGRPLITTEPGSPTPELVHGENVWFVPANAPHLLAQAIQTLAAHPDWRDRLGHGAHQLADPFTWDKIAAQTAAYLRQMVARR